LFHHGRVDGNQEKLYRRFTLMNADQPTTETGRHGETVGSFDVHPPGSKRTPCHGMAEETFSGSLDFAPIIVFIGSILYALRSR